MKTRENLDRRQSRKPQKDKSVPETDRSGRPRFASARLGPPAATQDAGISSSAMLSEAADRMRIRHTDSLPVLENRRIAGRITECDVARLVAAGLDPTTTAVKYALKADPEEALRDE